MEFIALTYKTLPIVKDCRIFESEKFDEWETHEEKKLIEISIVEKGAVSLSDIEASESSTYREGDVYALSHEKSLVFSAEAHFKQATIYFTPDDIQTHLGETEVLSFVASSQEQNTLTAIIPYSFSAELGKLFSLRINQLLDNNSIPDSVKTVRNTAILAEILSISTMKSIEMAQKVISGARHYNYTFYCQQAMRYINNHINEIIDVEDIAASMKVSYGHLSRLFKKQTGQTLIDYINKQKVKRMEEILWTKEVALSEIASSVGIADEKYAARLFKKYNGLSMSAYVKMNKLGKN